MTSDAAPVTVAGGPVSGLRLTLSRMEATISGRLLRLAPAEMAGLRIEAKRIGPDESELATRNGWPVEPGGRGPTSDAPLPGPPQDERRSGTPVAAASRIWGWRMRPKPSAMRGK